MFDHVRYALDPFDTRLARINGKTSASQSQVLLHNLAEVERYEDKMLALGFEGIMLRQPFAPYKHGRATLREGFLMKLKRFTDAEFKVIGFVERQHNGNEDLKTRLAVAKDRQQKRINRDVATLVQSSLRGQQDNFINGSDFDRLSFSQERDNNQHYRRYYTF